MNMLDISDACELGVQEESGLSLVNGWMVRMEFGGSKACEA